MTHTSNIRFASTMYMKNIVLRLVTMLLVSVVCSTAHAVRTTTYMHSDALGSVVAASDENGDVLWRKNYQPFGRQVADSSNADSLAYSGKKFDKDTRLNYFGARYYDSEIGRFVSIDPAGVLETIEGSPMQFSRYAYANNNPYKFVDPDGEFPFLIPVVIFIAKEIAAEVASRATNGATDFLSVRRLGTKAIKKSAKYLTKNKSAPKSEGLKQCFVAGTLIHTADGQKAIEKIKVGDLVLSKDEVFGHTVYKEVTQLFVNHDKSVLDVVINVDGVKQPLGITEEHPVWVTDKGWVLAQDLKIGDYVNNLSNAPGTIESVSERQTKHTTYNFEVKDFHTYFVGQTGVWVHNMCAEKVPEDATKGGPDFIVSRNGTAVHASQSELKKSITGAGARSKGPTTQTSEAGEIFEMNTPSGSMDIRVMTGKTGGGPNSGPRTITTRSNTNDFVHPNGQRITGNASKADRRAIGHTHGQRE